MTWSGIGWGDLEDGERLADGPVAPGRRRRLVAFDLVDALVANVRVAAADHLDRELVQALEVIARVRHLPRLVAQPLDHLADAHEEALLLLLRVRVVVPQVALAAARLHTGRNDACSLFSEFLGLVLYYSFCAHCSCVQCSAAKHTFA